MHNTSCKGFVSTLTSYIASLLGTLQFLWDEPGPSVLPPVEAARETLRGASFNVHSTSETPNLSCDSQRNTHHCVYSAWLAFVTRDTALTSVKGLLLSPPRLPRIWSCHSEKGSKRPSSPHRQARPKIPRIPRATTQDGHPTSTLLVSPCPDPSTEPQSRRIIRTSLIPLALESPGAERVMLANTALMEVVCQVEGPA